MIYRITKEEAIKELNYYRYCLDFQFGWFGEYDNEVIDMAIKALQTESAQGEWIKTVDGNGWNEWSVLQCPLCGIIIKDKQYHSWKYNYCPSCGKRIKGGDIE